MNHSETPNTSTKNSIWSHTITLILVGIFCCMLWGSAYPCIKVGYRLFAIASDDPASQIFFAGCRFALAGVLVILTGSVLQKHWLVPRIHATEQCPSDVKAVLEQAFFKTILQYVFFYMGLAHASAARSSIINGASSFISILFAVYMFRMEKMSARKMAGCGLGFVGVVLVETLGQTVDFGFSWNGEGFIIISVIATSLSAVLMKRSAKNHDPVMVSGWQFLLGGLAMAVFAYLAGGRMTIDCPVSILLLLYMAFLSAAAYTLWGVLLKYHPVSHVTIFQFVTPIAGVVLSSIILGETGALNAYTLIALVLVSLGIVVVARE